MSLHCGTCGCKSCRCCRKCGDPVCKCPKPKKTSKCWRPPNKQKSAKTQIQELKARKQQLQEEIKMIDKELNELRSVLAD